MKNHYSKIQLLLPLLIALSSLQPTWCAAQASASGLEHQAERRFEEDDLPGAIALYRQLVRELTPPTDKVRVLMTIAWIEHLSSNNRGAIETLTEALQLQPETPFRAELYSDGFRDLFHEARQLAENRRQRAASGSINDALQAMRLRDWPNARRLLVSALENLPNQPTALYNLALVDLYEERPEEAMAGFQKVLALGAAQPDTVSPQTRALALTNLGFLFNSRQLYDEAEDALAQAVEIDPRNASAWTNLGVTRRRLDRKQDAAEAFRRAYEVLPNDPSVLNNLALAYLDAEDWSAAVGLLLDATGKFADNPGLWLNLGLAQRGLGNEKGSVEALRTVLRLEPRNSSGFAASAAVHLARHYYDRGDYSAAVSQAESAVGWQPEQVEAWLYLGLSQQALGELDPAKASFQQAIAQDPTRAEAHNNLGNLYLSLGELRLARESFNRALSVDPGFEDARNNLVTLEKVASGEVTTGSRPRNSPTHPTPPRSSSPPPPPTTQQPQSPHPSARATASGLLGLSFARIDYGSFGVGGALVASVEPDSPASRAGLVADDLLVRVDGRAISDPEQLRAYIERQVPGATLDLVILRQNLPKKLALRTR